MTTPSPGMTAKAAADRLLEFYADVSRLLCELDTRLSDRGWIPSEATRISYDANNQLEKPAGWLIRYFARVYTRKQKGHDALAFGVVVNPAGYEEAICFVVGVKYPQPVEGLFVWNEWTEDEFLVDAFDGHIGQKTLDATTRGNGLFATASEARGFSLPAAAIDGAESLESKVIIPALKLLD